MAKQSKVLEVKAETWKAPRERVRVVVDLPSQPGMSFSRLLDTLTKLSSLMPADATAWAQTGGLVIEGLVEVPTQDQKEH